MSSEKPDTETHEDKPIKVIVETREEPARNQTARVEVVSLSIDEDFDLGGDPYNRTGQFVALELKDEEYE